jgi:LacI family transcriptional regulator
MTKSVTLQDVATASGVSIQTVSRVVNRKSDVAEETRLRVWQVIRQLGYRPNKVARSLVSQRSHILGIISLPLVDPFRPEVITAVEREARVRGYGCLLGFLEEDMEDLPILLDQMLERQVDGILLIGGKLYRQPLLPFTVPCVSLACPIEDEKVLNVDVDNLDGSYQATSHLIGLGHKAIGVIAGPKGWKAAQDRLEGARRALVETGQELEESRIEWALDWSLDAGYWGARVLLDRHPKLTALFCHNDWLAMGAFRALGERGLRVPADVSVIGYDDTAVCPYVVPPLSSVNQSVAGLGELITQLVINAIEHGNTTPSAMLIKTALAIRASTAPISECVSKARSQP